MADTVNWIQAVYQQERQAQVTQSSTAACRGGSRTEFGGGGGGTDDVGGVISGCGQLSLHGYF